MTRAQYDAGLDAICDRFDWGSFPTPAQARALNEALERFKATAVITESGVGKQAKQMAARPVDPQLRALIETAVKAADDQIRARRAAEERERRITAEVDRQVKEALAEQRLTEAIRTADTNDLAGVIAAAHGTASPFWQGAQLTEALTGDQVHMFHQNQQVGPDHLTKEPHELMRGYLRRQQMRSPFFQGLDAE